ncbi:hypothetical protein ACFPM7_08945 [Actinokineospora guangxiensis]|uniref:Histidine kinase n=1 Tax=Actinokineospora guangxiensis TaxID=1490288 RepID=A0ABW0ELJ3_9PSEU
MNDALEVGRGVSALWLRAAVGLLGAAITADLVLAGAPAPVYGIAAVLALLCPLLPASPVPLVLIVLAASSAALSAPEPFSAAVLVLVPLAHALHLACGFAAVLPAGARVSPAAFRAPLRRAAAIQLAVGLMAVGASFLPAGRTAPGVEFVALLSSAAMALAVILLERSRS